MLTKQQYKAACERIEELLQTVGNETPTTDRNFIELDFLSDFVAEYEKHHFPIGKLTLPDVLKTRMIEQNLSQKRLAALLGISASRVSEYLRGKSDPTLRIARRMHERLDIDANILLCTA
ncbi:MAG: helix-turn-helix domain-containing protein [Prevotellaceae bacterium]|jgi:HTH-type transcriptional regulator/antitoxin HigA|nr:helix-turn-helix domain-containing protein [Prevotellaceae bacterium]